jgi:anti-sigma factor RsiW
MTHDELRLLLGSYALDALDHDETEAVRRHLEGCGECEEELSGFLHVAAALGTDVSEAPPEIWERIASRLHDEVPPGPPLRLAPASGRRRWTWRQPALVGVAAVVAAAIALLGWDVSRLDSKVGNLQSAISRTGIAQSADAAALAPGSRLIGLRTASDAVVADVAILPSGQAYVFKASLPVLRSSKTYQLWGLSGTRLISLGLLGPGGAPAGFRLSPGISALMVTAEPAGGVVAPTTPVLARATI